MKPLIIRLRPSSAERWVNCAGAPSLEALYPFTGNKYSTEGVLAHSTLAAVMLNKSLPDTCDADMIEHAYGFKHYDSDYLSDKTVLMDGVETRFDFTKVLGTTKQQTGYIDRWAVFQYPNGSIGLYVCDYKYGAEYNGGKANRVRAMGNEQLLLYVRAVIERVHNEMAVVIDDIIMCIYQPRITNGTSLWTITLNDFWEHWERIETSARATGATTTAVTELPFVPGGHCNFCSGRLYCKALYEQFKEFSMFIENFNGDPELIENAVLDLTDESLLRLADEWAAVKRLGKAVEDEIDNRVIHGLGLPGYRKELVQSGRNTVTDEPGLVKLLEDAANEGNAPLGLTYTTCIAPHKLLKALKTGYTELLEEVSKHVKKPGASVKAVRIYDCDDQVGSYDPAEDMPKMVD